MKIKQRYYTESQKLWDEIKSQEDERKAGLTDQERAQEKEESKRKTAEIIRQAEERTAMRVINKERLINFGNISDAALWLAKAMGLDIEINTQRDCGEIELSTDMMIFNGSSGNIRKVFESLLHSADEVWIQSINGIVTMNFRYEFCDEIRK